MQNPAFYTAAMPGRLVLKKHLSKIKQQLIIDSAMDLYDQQTYTKYNNWILAGAP